MSVKRYATSRRRISALKRALCAAGVLCAFAACGDNADPGDGEPVDVTGELLPFKAGNSWTYQVTEDGETSSKVTTIGAEELVGGTGPHQDARAYKVVTKKGAADMTVSWQASVEGRIVRYREQSFHASTGALELEEHWDPAKLHIDDSPAHRAAGSDWLEEYKETKTDPINGTVETTTERDHWYVDSVDESISVPAGTFRAVVFRKVGGSSSKTYWYVRGIGKVRETGGQTEELMSYEVAP